MTSKASFSNALMLFLCSLASSVALNVAKAEDKAIQAASAVDLMKSAHEGRAMWDRFPGFKAKVKATTDTETVSGTLEVDADGTMKLTMDGGAKVEWAERTLGSVLSHRRATSEFESAVEFADEN